MGKNRRKTHAEMQKSVCVACLAPGCVRTVQPGPMTDKIREVVVGDFGPDVESLPQGICESCRLKLSRNKLQCSVNYNLLRKRGVFQCLQGQENFCQCYICVIQRDTQFKAKPKGAPKQSVLPDCCLATRTTAGSELGWTMSSTTFLPMLPSRLPAQSSPVRPVLVAPPPHL